MEKKIRTQSLLFRVCSSILAMIVVDSWLLYKGCMCNTSSYDVKNQSQFYNSLATEPIDLNRDQRSSPRNKSTEAKANRSNPQFMLILEKRSNFDFAIQRRCIKCSKKTMHQCCICYYHYQSSVYLCAPKTGRNCLAQHTNDALRHLD